MHFRLFLIITILCTAVFLAGAPAHAQEGISEPLTTVLQVPLPFVPENPNLSDYIKGVYRLLIGTAALFAVVMLIIAGYQWIFSGGSSDKTGDAKKRIFGAAIGLMLALLSYVILNTITPRLIVLRLPDIKPVPGFEFVKGETCGDSERLAQMENKLGSALVVMPAVLPPGHATTPVPLKQAQCGTKYIVYDAKGKPIDECTGGLCENNSVCINSRCVDAIVYGGVTWNKAQLPPYHSHLVQIEVYKLCDAGPYTVLNKVADNSFDKPDFYRVPHSELTFIDEECKTLQTYLGYALAVWVDDTFGDEDNVFLVGNNCSVSIANRSEDIWLGQLTKDIAPSELITADQLRSVFECNLDLTQSGFADYD